jgi:hypothetical protein
MQQINLAKYVGIPIKSPLDARKILSIYAVFLAILMFVYLCGGMLKHFQLVELNDLKSSLDETRKNLIFTAAKFPQSEVTIKLLDTSRLPSCSTKFSTYLLGFSKAIIPGAWLTDIVVSNNGKQINLRGYTLQASKAQQYLIQLKQLPEFADYSFELTELTQVTDLNNSKKAISQSLNFQVTAKMAVGHE